MSIQRLKRFGMAVLFLSLLPSCGKGSADRNSHSEMTADEKAALAIVARASAGHLSAEERVGEYTKALKLDPKSRLAKHGLAEAQFMQGKTETAISAWKELETKRDAVGNLAKRWISNVEESRHSERARKWIERMRKSYKR